MSDLLREQLEGAKSLVILRRAHVDAISRRADASAAKIVALHKELRKIEREIKQGEVELLTFCAEQRQVELQIAQDEKSVAVLENAVADAEIQAPIAMAFNKLGYRSHLMQGDPTHHKVLQS